MGGKKFVLSESTVVPLGFVGALLGGVFWLSTMYNQGQANAKAIEELKVGGEEYTKTLQKIDRRLSWIEGAMGKRKTGGPEDSERNGSVP